MSLLITSVLVASGVLLGRWIAKGGRGSQKQAEGRSTDEQQADQAAHGPDAHGQKEAGAPPEGATSGTAPVDDFAAKGEPKKARKPPRPSIEDLFADMPCKLGDVVMRSGGDEAWLAGAIVFSEQHPVAALFVAPDAGKDRAIYARVRPNGQLTWLEPVDSGEITLGAEPPTSIEHASIRYERARRLPVRVDRAGSGAPDVGEQVTLAEYASNGFDRLVVVTGGGAARMGGGGA